MNPVSKLENWDGVLIGLTGSTGSGKSTIAGYMRDAYGFTEYSWAAPLKKAISTLLMIPLESLNTREGKNALDPISRRPYRNIMVEVGSMLKQIMGASFFVELGNRHLQELIAGGCKKIVVSDCRFLVEGNYIVNNKGYIAALVTEQDRLWRAKQAEALKEQYNMSKIEQWLVPKISKIAKGTTISTTGAGTTPAPTQTITTPIGTGLLQALGPPGQGQSYGTINIQPLIAMDNLGDGEVGQVKKMAHHEINVYTEGHLRTFMQVDVMMERLGCKHASV